MMQIAFYKAPGTLADRLVRMVTGSPYSHCELVINGTACSSSIRDGGVRMKGIYLDPAKWDVVEVDGDVTVAWSWFATHVGERYDWAGVFRFVIPFLPHRRRQWFCSEACAAALGLPDPADWTPGMLARQYIK
jgi:hypothetical protein